ncbi:golgin subfamily A member 6-like protein 22 isoform X1 [Amia ocellicauda]|uniref:golgin subfamily A member 6-like protein 22 isoform X1 n=2 Tax=Amia ocellicauda TaxID=2972642 RepID=UPI003463C818
MFIRLTTLICRDAQRHWCCGLQLDPHRGTSGPNEADFVNRKSFHSINVQVREKLQGEAERVFASVEEQLRMSADMLRASMMLQLLKRDSECLKQELGQHLTVSSPEEIASQIQTNALLEKFDSLLSEHAQSLHQTTQTWRNHLDSYIFRELACLPPDVNVMDEVPSVQDPDCPLPICCSEEEKEERVDSVEEEEPEEESVHSVEEPEEESVHSVEEEEPEEESVHSVEEEEAEEESVHSVEEEEPEEERVDSVEEEEAEEWEDSAEEEEESEEWEDCVEEEEEWGESLEMEDEMEMDREEERERPVEESSGLQAPESRAEEQKAEGETGQEEIGNNKEKPPLRQRLALWLKKAVEDKKTSQEEGEKSEEKEIGGRERKKTGICEWIGKQFTQDSREEFRLRREERWKRDREKLYVQPSPPPPTGLQVPLPEVSWVGTFFYYSPEDPTLTQLQETAGQEEVQRAVEEQREEPGSEAETPPTKMRRTLARLRVLFSGRGEAEVAAAREEEQKEKRRTKKEKASFRQRLALFFGKRVADEQRDQNEGDQRET